MGRVGLDHCMSFYDDSDVQEDSIVTCSPDVLGERMRTGWWRGREVLGGQVMPYMRSFSFYVAGAVANDYLFVATALGEDCFK